MKVTGLSVSNAKYGPYANGSLEFAPTQRIKLAIFKVSQFGRVWIPPLESPIVAAVKMFSPAILVFSTFPAFSCQYSLHYHFNF